MKKVIALIRGHLFTFVCRYGRKNISIDRGLALYCSLEIRGDGAVTIGKNCIVSGVIGDSRHYVTIYTHDKKASVSIGENAHLYAARISSKFEVRIGDDFLIENAGIADTDFHSINLDRGEPTETLEKCRVRIGDRVSIGERSVVCKGTVIGDDVLVYPGSIVSKSVPSGSIVCGNPARRVGK
jgi:acetyltransferase-like isoleucine patch superfamily enzyme